MKWAEFKEKIETKGVTDEDDIVFIDALFPNDFIVAKNSITNCISIRGTY